MGGQGELVMGFGGEGMDQDAWVMMLRFNPGGIGGDGARG